MTVCPVPPHRKALRAMTREYMVASETEYSHLANIATTNDVVDVHQVKHSLKPTHDYAESIWARYLLGQPINQSHGWKLHVSATPKTWQETVDIVAPILVKHNSNFKVLRDSKFVRISTARWWNQFRIGKFYTVYEPEEGRLRSIASELRHSLSHLAGPMVLTDRPVSDSTTVYYRWGEYWPANRLLPNGTPNHAVRNGQNLQQTWTDRRELFSLPAWIKDVELGSYDESPDPNLERYEITKAIRFSGRGGVYRAVERSTGRRCVIKEARALTDWDETHREGRERIENEIRIHRLLADAAPPLAPELMDSFRSSRHTYAVFSESYTMDVHEWLGAYASLIQIESDDSAFVRARSELMDQICSGVQRLHEAGVAHGDLSPANIRFDPETGRVQFIDFEAGGDKDLRPAFAARTPGFSPPSDARMTLAERDMYSLRRIGQNLTTGKALLCESDEAAFHRVTAFYEDHLVGEARNSGKYSTQLEYAWKAPPTSLLTGRFKPGISTLDTNGTSFGYGIGGTLAARLYTGSAVTEVEGEEFAHQVATRPLPAGLSFGLAGAAVVLARLGQGDAALDTILRAQYHARIDSSYTEDHSTGIAGIGSAAVQIACLTQNSTALDVAHWCLQRILESSHEDEHGLGWKALERRLGLFHGPTGVADFFCSLGMLESDESLLTLASRALLTDFSACRNLGDNARRLPRQRNGGHGTTPYVGAGTAGVALVALRLASAGLTQWRLPSKQLVTGASGRIAISPTYLTGAAGILDVLLAASRSGLVELPSSAFTAFANGWILTIASENGDLVGRSEDMQRHASDFLTGGAGIAAIHHKLTHEGEVASPWVNCWSSDLRGGMFS